MGKHWRFPALRSLAKSSSPKKNSAPATANLASRLLFRSETYCVALWWVFDHVGLLKYALSLWSREIIWGSLIVRVCMKRKMGRVPRIRGSLVAALAGEREVIMIQYYQIVVNGFSPRTTSEEISWLFRIQKRSARHFVYWTCGLLILLVWKWAHSLTSTNQKLRTCAESDPAWKSWWI